MHRKRNEIERLFRRLKGVRRIFSRFEKLDRPIPGLPHFHPNRRGLAIVLTRPSVLSRTRTYAANFGDATLGKQIRRGTKSRQGRQKTLEAETRARAESKKQTGKGTTFSRAEKAIDRNSRIIHFANGPVYTQTFRLGKQITLASDPDGNVSI